MTAEKNRQKRNDKGDPHIRRRWIWGLNLCLALLLCASTFTGALKTADCAVADAMYQRPEAQDGSIVVVGITTDDLQRFGRWPWDRSVLAQVIETLNADENCRPAAIGVDVLFSGESSAASDAALVAAASAGNVAVACTAQFDTDITFDSSGAAADGLTAASIAMPFDALAQSCAVGHTNAMYDTDGVLRHHLWAVPNGSGGQQLSLPCAIYSLYCSYWDMPADYAPDTDASGFWYVDYSGAPGDFYEYSVSDILDGRFDSSVLEGAAVLIGPYDAGLSDDFVTSIDHARRMYGVEYLANVLSAVMRGAVIHEVGRLPQLIAMFALSLLMGVCFFSMKLRRGIPLFLGVIAVSLGGCLLSYSLGYLLHPLWLPLAAGVLFFVSLGVQAAVTHSEKLRMRRTFQRYVDSSILQELLSETPDSLKLHGSSRDIAVLFVDLRGFTALSERMDPEQLVDMLNEYLTVTSECIRAHSGTLDKYIGDCTMAFWGAPLACGDPVYSACRAAMDMAERADELHRAAMDKYGCAVSFGIGIDYGPAIVGNIGSADRMDYTAIGSTVNTASRLEGLAPAGQIYITREVVEALGNRAVITPLGQIPVKGKASDFEIFRLESLK